MSEDMKVTETLEESAKSEKKKPGPKPKQPKEDSSTKVEDTPKAYPEGVPCLDSEDTDLTAKQAEPKPTKAEPEKVSNSAVKKESSSDKQKEIIVRFERPIYLYSHPNVAKALAKTSGLFILRRQVNDMFVEVIAKLPGRQPGKYYIRSSAVSRATLERLK